MKKNNHKLILTLVLMIGFTVEVNAQRNFDTARQAIEQRVTEGYLLGVAAAYIHPDGRVQYFSLGSLSEADDKKPTKNTIYEIGSISKTFTSLMLARMVEQGALSLDTPIGSILPDSISVPVYNGQKITLLHLATHTSGLPRMPSNFSPADPLNPYADYTVQQLYEFLEYYELTRTPGSKIVYSNLGVGLLGHLLALKSGLSYSQLFQKYITGPLGMKDTEVNVPKSKYDRFAAPYRFGRPVKRWDLPTLVGAGGIRSTAVNMATYMKAQMDFAGSPIDSAIQMTHQIQFEDTTGLTSSVGLGWFYATKHDTIIWHNGGTGGYHSFAGWNIETHAGVVVLASGASVTNIGLHILDKRHDINEIPVTVKVKPSTLISYVGTYVSTASGLKFYVTTQKNQLWVQLIGQSKFRVYPKSPTRFFYKIVDAEIEFRVDSAGPATGLTLYQNGREIRAEKISDDILKKKRQTVILDPKTLNRYVGTYQLKPGYNARIFKKGDHLMVKLPFQPAYQLYSESKTHFFLKVSSAEIAFIANEEGAFTKIKWYQGEKVLAGERLD